MSELVNHLAGFDLDLAIYQAEQYRLYKSFIKFVYFSRQRHNFEKIYALIQANCFPIEFALQVVYDCDVEHVRNAPSDSIKTYNPEYEGSQIFTIFDTVKYKEDLGKFLERQNRGMYAIWTIRNQDQPKL